MAGNLTDTAEAEILKWLDPAKTPTRPATGLQVALITTDSPSSDSAAGSEVTGGSYARKDLTLSAPSGGSYSNSADLTWTGMPACTVGGVEIWDKAGTPVRIWWGTLSAQKTVNAGDTFTITAGSLTLSLD